MKTKAAPAKKAGRKWSARVTKESHALDLQPDVFKFTSARKIALSLKHSAEVSRNRKGTAFQSAMSMLNFYINRAGRGLPAERKAVLKRAKGELRNVFDKE